MYIGITIWQAIPAVDIYLVSTILIHQSICTQYTLISIIHMSLYSNDSPVMWCIRYIRFIRASSQHLILLSICHSTSRPTVTAKYYSDYWKQDINLLYTVYTTHVLYLKYQFYERCSLFNLTLSFMGITLCDFLCICCMLFAFVFIMTAYTHTHSYMQARLPCTYITVADFFAYFLGMGSDLTYFLMMMT